VGSRTSKSVHDGCTGPHRLGGVHSRYCYFIYYSPSFPSQPETCGGRLSLYFACMRVFFSSLSSGSPTAGRVSEHSSPRISSKRLYILLWMEHLQQNNHPPASVRHLSTTCQLLPTTAASFRRPGTQPLPPVFIVHPVGARLTTVLRPHRSRYCIERRGGVPTDSGMESPSCNQT